MLGEVERCDLLTTHLFSAAAIWVNDHIANVRDVFQSVTHMVDIRFKKTYTFLHSHLLRWAYKSSTGLNAPFASLAAYNGIHVRLQCSEPQFHRSACIVDKFMLQAIEWGFLFLLCSHDQPSMLPRSSASVFERNNSAIFDKPHVAISSILLEPFHIVKSKFVNGLYYFCSSCLVDVKPVILNFTHRQEFWSHTFKLISNLHTWSENENNVHTFCSLICCELSLFMSVEINATNRSISLN